MGVRAAPMAHYTRFYFRAKLIFRLPAEVAATLQAQCAPWPASTPLPPPFSIGWDLPAPEEPSWQYPDEPDLEADARQERRQVLDSFEPAATPSGLNWAGWHAHPHAFFSRPRAHAIPRGTNTPGDGGRAPDFRRYADGGARLEFECEFKNYDGEIESFLDWIAPYVRPRFGKRSRGRRMVWVGWMRPECAERHLNIFVVPGDWTSGAEPRVIIR